MWYAPHMPHRTSIHDDPNEAAFRGVQKLIEQSEGKNPAAVALGRLGGLKGWTGSGRGTLRKEAVGYCQESGSGTLGTCPRPSVPSPQ